MVPSLKKLKLAKLKSKGYSCWVLGGNHSYQAVMQVREACPQKHFYDKVFVQIWWFENLEDKNTLEAIELLAAHHNIDQEFRKDWDFVDKLNFLRRKYVRAEMKWTEDATKEAVRALGYSSAKSLNPMLQLVAGSKEKWEALARLLATTKEKVNSEAKFRCLQGELSEDQVITLLNSVAQGTKTLDQMANEAGELKLDYRVKIAAAQLLKLKNFEEVVETYGALAFSDTKRRSFWPAFAKLKERKGRKKSVSRSQIEVPDTFSRYVEQVRQTHGNIGIALETSLKPFHVKDVDHYVFELDATHLARIVSDRPKFPIGKPLDFFKEG